MKTLAGLIDHLKERKVLRTPAIIDAFGSVDRRHFVPDELLDFAYADEPLPIGEGQTISQPYTVAFMLELLKPKKGDTVLDVGSGSGYTTALLAKTVGDQGKIIGVEIIPKLVEMGRKNIAEYKFKNASIREATGTLGVPEKAPYDKILVSASARGLPKALVQQLKRNGVMVASVGDAIWKIKKHTDDDIEIEKYPGFAFVPLIGN